jgi:hypothetical protein
MTENNQKISTGRGGKRTGSGRKPGSANTKTREIADKAIEDGTTPLEVMLRAMRRHVDAADKLGNGKIKVVDGNVVSQLSLLTEAAKIAKDAAPYIHPRLSAVDHTSKGENINGQYGVLVVPATMSLDEWTAEAAAVESGRSNQA